MIFHSYVLPEGIPQETHGKTAPERPGYAGAILWLLIPLCILALSPNVGPKSEVRRGLSTLLGQDIFTLKCRNRIVQFSFLYIYIFDIIHVCVQKCTQKYIHIVIPFKSAETNVSQVLRQCSSGIGTWYIYVHLTVLTEFKKIMMITTTWIENHGFFHDFLSKTWTFPVAILRCLPQLGLFDSLAPCPAAAIRGCRSGGWHEGRAAASLGGMGWDGIYEWKLGGCTLYPLVMTNIANWKITMLLRGKSS